MSQIYSVGEESLWNPSNGAARLFHRQVALFEAELGLPSGIGPLENDECEIDPHALGRFTEALLAHQVHSGHAVIRALSEGFAATVLVLAQRSGVTPARSPAPPDSLEGRRDVQVPLSGPSGPGPAYEPQREDRLRAAARELSRSMPR